MTPSAASTGAVAARPPTAPTKMYQPVIVARRESGNQSVNALIATMRHADTPRPISARPTASVPNPLAPPNATAPNPVTHSSVATTRRGP